VLSFYTREQSHAFTDDEIAFLTTLGGQVAIAIDNSRLYEQSRRQAAELGEAVKVRDEFLSVMSHELRTPLNVVVGYTDMLLDKALGDLNHDQKDALEKVLRRSTDLLGMINQILQVTSLEARQVFPDIQLTDLKELLRELTASYNFPLRKDVTMHWDLATDLPVIETDGEKLRHVLENLVNNAIKFTENGRITISARRLPKSELVEFKVADTGIGIPNKAFPIIFEMFRQVDSSETRTHGGVGVGLYIVKKYTDILGGRVDVVSEPNKGSTFSVVLPVRFTRGLS
jgi:signal transduction histidine kinase